MIVDDIAITASRSAKSRVKIIRYSFHPAHGNVTRQIRIYPQRPCRIFAQCGRFEMDNLPGAVNAGIGAPGAEHVNRFICHLRERFFQLFLHAAHFILTLPAIILAAVVLNTQRNFIDRR
ncbi:Uncharacterised protein [Salmonella enterica subsp. enterica serovar Typhi]|nr:Uncharacterised protein [Salmonella enterica subsp. enterica serovar Typhi]CGY87326.1 Uncharacterised protein [Salmonella enterica subsp. enterica serovar Typhi]CHM11638.1 Uncharacterised protein [Salmonella enterica subsp. enterica serovar Typhi]CWZ06293.1 Uncharacterised protein [Salmonella enterica subsp. enterica serovar Typhi]